MGIGRRLLLRLIDSWFGDTSYGTGHPGTAIGHPTKWQTFDVLAHEGPMGLHEVITGGRTGRHDGHLVRVPAASTRRKRMCTHIALEHISTPQIVGVPRHSAIFRPDISVRKPLEGGFIT